MFQPRSISQAMGLARLQEDTVEALNKKTRAPLKTVPPYSTVPQKSSESFPRIAESSGSVKRITPKEFDESRAKGLCFGCHEKYFRGHVCKKKQLFMIDIGEAEEEFVEAQQELTPDDKSEQFHISVHTLSGIQSYRTMRIKGIVKKTEINILVDSGSTHNFLDPRVAKRSGVRIHPTNPLTIIVADGTKILALVKDLQWSIQGIEFSSEVRLLPLGGCDMVLGIQWLSTLGPILWDFQHLQMQFSVSGRKLILNGETATDVRIVDAKKMQHLLNKQPSGMMAQLCSIQPVPTREVPSDLLQIRHTFQDIFMEPKSLPPCRTHDHQIPLKPGAQPPNIRPYRCP